jgi:hypothetical protein
LSVRTVVLVLHGGGAVGALADAAAALVAAAAGGDGVSPAHKPLTVARIEAIDNATVDRLFTFIPTGTPVLNDECL